MSNPQELQPKDLEPVLTPEEEAEGTEKWRKLLLITATLLALFAVVAIVIRIGMSIHHTLLLFSLGGLVAYALDPLVEGLKRRLFGESNRPVHRSLSVFAVFAGIFLVLAGGLFWLGDQAVKEGKIIQSGAPMYKQRAITMAHSFDEQVLKPRNITFSVEDSIQKPPPEIGIYAQRASSEALPFIAHTASAAVESVIVLLIALYFLIFATEMKEKVNEALPRHILNYALPWERDVNRILGGFVRGQLILGLITGGVAALGLALIGVHLWLFIGLFVVGASLIPVIGPYIGAIPAVIAALVGPTHFASPVVAAVVVGVLFLILNEAGSKILYPKLVGHALNLHEVVVLFVLLAGLELDGIIGALFAAPITALTIVSLVHLYRLWQEAPESSIADENEKRSAEHKGMSPFKRPKKAPQNA